MDAGDSYGPWGVYCRCGVLNGEYRTETEALTAALAHPPSERRCSEVSMTPCRPGTGFAPTFLLGEDCCSEASVDQDADGQWQTSCACGALDSLCFPTREDAQDAMDEHLAAEDSRSRVLFNRLAGEGFEGRLSRG